MMNKLLQIQILKDWFNNKHDKWAIRLQRDSRLGKEEEIVDTFRNKTYKSLTDLDLEAEVVREEIRELEQ